MLGKAQPVYDRMLLEITLQLTDNTYHTTLVHNAYKPSSKVPEGPLSLGSP